MDIREQTGSETETSPNRLKNTPSNIRRLADEIEQYEGRQKYRAQTRSPSDGGDVKWYFCKVPLAENELAASVPATDIVRKGDYFRFGMRDSLAIEASFLQREGELLSSWWEEYAECSVGPVCRSDISSKSKAHLERNAPESTRSSHLLPLDEERVGVPVKGGLYEVDLTKRHCFPVYWNGENRRVLRGHWFARKGGLDWLPLREDISEQLEFAYRCRVWHRRTFQPSGLYAARISLQGSTPGLNALFTGEDDTWDAWLSVDVSGLSNVINVGWRSIQLRRGYAPPQLPKPTQDELRQQREEEMGDYCSQVPVRHLVFMVHGIGQRLGNSTLVDDVEYFRHITASLAEQHLTPYQRGTQRVLYIPCQWRRGLKLGGEEAVDKITLDGVRGLRVMLSATVHDVLYYMSPIYCQTIIDSVSNQLNRLYLRFLKRNPGYDGKVSLWGHSLGSVLSYDILCHQETLSSPFPMEWMFKQHDRDEHSASSMNSNQTSETNFISNPRVENLTNDEHKSMTTDVDEVDVSQQPEPGTISSENAQETCIPLDPPESSESDEPSNDSDIKLEENALVADESSNDDFFDINDMISSKDEGINQPPSSRSEATEPQEMKIEQQIPKDQEVPDCEKGTTIKSLLEEIDMLKEKIKTLEGKGHENNTPTSTSQSAPEPQKTLWKCNSRKSYTPYINYTKLAFKVDNFFAVGSPLGVFLSLRNIRIGIGEGYDYWEEESINEEMPACRQMFNIFHPFDPVAYRIEPLICKEYLDKRPVIIPYHRGGKRLHTGFQEFTEGLASRSRSFTDHIGSVTVKVLKMCQSSPDVNGIEDESDNVKEKEERSYGSHMIEKLTGAEDGRIDHVLQDSTFAHPYISAIGSHTSYWRDYDTALFILKHLYREIPEEPSSDHEAAESSSTRYEGWFDQSDEELPLIFGDRKQVNTFSRQAKRAMMR